jgi:hypothetical protein
VRSLRTFAAVGLALLVGAAALGPVESSQGVERTRCSDPHYRVLAQFPDGVLARYSGTGDLMACSHQVGRYIDIQGSEDVFGPFAFAGRFVAFQRFEANSGAEPAYNFLIVVDLARVREDVRSEHRRYSLQNADDVDRGVGSMVLRKNGHVAWIDCTPTARFEGKSFSALAYNRCARRSEPGIALTRRVVRNGHVLTQSTRISPKSLRSVRRTRACWRLAAQQRCAQLD